MSESENRSGQTNCHRNLIYNIYFNELTSLKVKGKIIFYADDTVVIFEGKLGRTHNLSQDRNRNNCGGVRTKIVTMNAKLLINRVYN